MDLSTLLQSPLRAISRGFARFRTVSSQNKNPNLTRNHMRALTLLVFILSTGMIMLAQPTSTKAPTDVIRMVPAAISQQSDSTARTARRTRTPRPPRPGVFTSLDSAMTMPDSVLVLSLRGKGLTSINGLTAFRNLQVLDLAGNALSAFPLDALKITALVSIDLSDNPIKSVPNEIGTLMGLSRLVLRNTGIKTLPASIGKCTNLTQLDLSRNLLTSLPVVELNLLPNLRTLSIGGFKDGPPADTTTPAPQPTKQK